MAALIMSEEDLTEAELGQDELLPDQVRHSVTRSQVAHLLNL